MGILDSFMKHVRQPQGLIGRLFMKGMNRTHHKRTNWGLQHVKVGEDFNILDIGCGGGRTISKLASMAPKGKVYGVDISEDSVKVARKYNKKLVNEGKVDIRVSSVSRLPFEDDTFDLVTAVETHYYWPDLEADLGEVLRVIKSDGIFLVIGGEYLGSRFDDRNRNWAKRIGMRLYTLEELKGIIANVGFKNVKVFEDYDEGWFCAIGKKSVILKRTQLSNLRLNQCCARREYFYGSLIRLSNNLISSLSKSNFGHVALSKTLQHLACAQQLTDLNPLATAPFSIISVFIPRRR